MRFIPGLAALLGSMMAIALPQAEAASPPAHSPKPTVLGCEALHEWRKARQADPSALRSAEETRVSQERIYNSGKSAARDVVSAYLSGSLTEGFLQNCLSNLGERRKFLKLLSPEFYDESLRRLASAKLPPLQALLKLLGQTEQSDVAWFSVASPELSGTGHAHGLKAGFHRAYRSLFMSMDEIPSAQWLLYFVHEIAHAADPMLKEASRIYSDQERVAAVSALSERFGELETLPQADRETLATFVRAGLDRGLLAELRAWSVSLALYEPGIEAGLWPRVDWVEEMLRRKPKTQALPSFVFRDLDPSFESPGQYPFNLPLLQQAVKAERESLARSPEAISLGALGEVVSNASALEPRRERAQ